MKELYLGKYDFKDKKGYGAITSQGVFRPIDFDSEAEALVIQGNNLREDHMERQLAELDAWKIYMAQLSLKHPTRGRPRGSKNRPRTL